MQYTKKKIKVIMISHLFPSPARANPNSGIFIKNQLKEYRKLADIFLYVPVDITPSISPIWQKHSIKGKTGELYAQFKRTFSKKLWDFDNPVPGKFIRFASIPPKSIIPFAGAMNLFARIKISLREKERFHLVHGQTVLPDGLGAVLLGNNLGIPTVVTVRGSDVHSIKKGSILYKTVYYTLNETSVITCVSEELKRRMVQNGIDEKKVVVIGNGIDLNFARSKILYDIREMFNIPRNGFVFLTVGRLTDVKDPYTLINAFRRLNQKKKNAHLIIVGGGPLENEVREYVKKLKIDNFIQLTGYIPHEEIPNYMKGCDIFCLSSLREGWPNVLFEAMAFGKPVIATKVGGIPEVVKNEDYGILVPKGDIDRMALAMTKAMEKKWNYENIKAYADDNSWEKVAYKYYNIYTRLVKNK